MKTQDLVFRSWYYFRTGYNTYLTFPIGYVSTLVTIYYLAIRNVSGLESIFPKFSTFGIVATIVSFPLSVAIGWGHLKRSQAWKSEIDVSTEANPYNYKLPPGYSKEVLFPLLQELLMGTTQLLDKQDLIDPSRRKHLEELQRKLDLLLHGGYVGHPRRSAM